MNSLGLLELGKSPAGVDPSKPIGQTRAQCPRCGQDRLVTADGRFSVHNDDNGAWCNGSREAVRA